MFNKHKFDLEMEKIRQEQVTMLSDYVECLTADGSCGSEYGDVSLFHPARI